MTLDCQGDETWWMCNHSSVRDDTDASIYINHSWCAIVRMTPGSHGMKPGACALTTLWEMTPILALICINHDWCVIYRDDTGLKWDETWWICTHFSVGDDTDAGRSINRDDTGMKWQKIIHYTVRDDTDASMNTPDSHGWNLSDMALPRMIRMKLNLFKRRNATRLACGWNQ